jgi:hypothetical protein
MLDLIQELRGDPRFVLVELQDSWNVTAKLPGDLTMQIVISRQQLDFTITITQTLTQRDVLSEGINYQPLQGDTPEDLCSCLASELRSFLERIMELPLRLKPVTVPGTCPVLEWLLDAEWSEVCVCQHEAGHRGYAGCN